ncbi:hypothetical protein E2C01_099202 [Portunus trituberculatus]|uniref:Uncharacterized protein n=1 Tax=Portunus trituberculatus TaxID=210409 RepID=A0A5B7K3A1_PORTR|nr:hypothetical protein [Portunus trituberculatus]
MLLVAEHSEAHVR